MFLASVDKLSSRRTYTNLERAAANLYMAAT